MKRTGQFLVALLLASGCWRHSTREEPGLSRELSRAGAPDAVLREDDDGARYLDLSRSRLADLSILRQHPVTGLNLSDCVNIKSLEPLRGMRLTFLDIQGTAAGNLSPLRDMPLVNFFFSPGRARKGVEAIRQIPSLININGENPKVFWREYDKPEAALLRQRGIDYDRVYVDTNGLWTLYLWKTGIADLAPLRGLPLQHLHLGSTRIENLSTLRGMPLETLGLSNTRVANLSPLAGMPLRGLDLAGCSNVVDIAPLAGSRLEWLALDRTGVRDLSPLRGAPLGCLMLEGSRVTDLSPLEGMSLYQLGISPRHMTNAVAVVSRMHTNGSVWVDHEFWPREMSPEDFCDKARHGDFTRAVIKSLPIPSPAKQYVSHRTPWPRAASGKEEPASSTGRFVLRIAAPRTNAEYCACYNVCTLVDRAAKTNIWQREFVHLGEVFVEDDGWVWAVSGDDYVAGIAPDGREYGRAYISWMSVFPKEHIIQTSNGTFWKWRYSHWFFLPFNQRLYFCISTWWGQHVLIDLYAGKHAVVDGPIRQAVDEELRQFVCEVLRDAVDRRVPLETEERTGSRLATVQAAVIMAGRQNIRDAIPYLGQLEKFECVGSGQADLASHGYTFAAGETNPFVAQRQPFRALVQMSLRRLGIVPASLTTFSFAVASRQPGMTDSWYTPPPLPTNRVTRVNLVRVGMTAKEVLAALGPPDFWGEYPRRHWDYDMDAERPYTLRLFWPAKVKVQEGRIVVTGTETIMPPVWQTSDLRERAVIE